MEIFCPVLFSFLEQSWSLLRNFNIDFDHGGESHSQEYRHGWGSQRKVTS